MPLNPPSPTVSYQPQVKYGAAAKYDFDNPNKWITEAEIPLLDEHEMTDEQGNPVTFVDRDALQEIADNNNTRVQTTGDPATLILGHTSDDPKAPEKPAYGFVVNYKVKPYKRDPQTGQIIYAIHGDFKYRHKYAGITERYPRRSVELWWNKKEIDPVALLGGTAPERDLSVTIRHARINHISLDHKNRASTAAKRAGVAPPDDDVIRFHRHRGGWVEVYSMPGLLRYAKDGKVEKVMSEFKSGQLHSGSKTGPKVTDRQQALAIGLSEAREAGEKVAKKYSEDRDDVDDQYEPSEAEKIKRRESDREKEVSDHQQAQKQKQDELDSRRNRRKPPPHYDFSSHDGEEIDMAKHCKDTTGRVSSPKKYADIEDEPDTGMDDGADDYDDPNDPDNDPVVAKVQQSKWAKGIDAKLDMILSALEGEAGGQPGMGMEPGVGDDGMEPNDGTALPPPPEESQGGESDLMDTDTGEGGPDQMGGGLPGEEEDESRLAHGNRPVQFESTGLPGPTNSNIPSFQKGKSMPPTKMSHHKMQRRQQYQAGSIEERVARLEAANQRLQAKNEELVLKLSRSEAEKVVNQLKGEGFILGNTAEEEAEEVELLAVLTPEEQASQVDLIRRKYKRVKVDPTKSIVTPRSPGLAQFSRNGAAEAESPEEFDPESPQEATDLADLMAVRGMSKPDAVKHLIKMRRHRQQM